MDIIIIVVQNLTITWNIQVCMSCVLVMKFLAHVESKVHS